MVSMNDDLFCPQCGFDDFLLYQSSEFFGACSATCAICASKYEDAPSGYGDTYEEAINAYMSGMYNLMYQANLWVLDDADDCDPLPN